MKEFWDNVEKTGSCWIWKAGLLKSGGYGRFWDGKVMHRSHRLAWELTNGAIPEGQCVLHRCDNPPCVRPDHLFLGTQLDNIADMNAKGRHNSSFDAEFARRRAQIACKKGHAYTPENLYQRKDGSRICKTCHLARVVRYRQREKINLVKPVL